MRHTYKPFFTVILLFSFFSSFSQKSPADSVASRITQKLSDTLFLSDTQRLQVYNINIQLAYQKQNQRPLYVVMDSLQLYTQKIEFTRDTLYYPVFSTYQYQLYKQKKATLISND